MMMTMMTATTATTTAPALSRTNNNDAARGSGGGAVSLRSGTLSSVHVDDDNDIDERVAEEVAAEVMRRIAKKYDSPLPFADSSSSKSKRSVWRLLFQTKKSSSSFLNLSHIRGLNTLREEAVQELHRHGVKRLDLSKNEAMVAVPETLVLCRQHQQRKQLYQQQQQHLQQQQQHHHHPFNHHYPAGIPDDVVVVPPSCSSPSSQQLPQQQQCPTSSLVLLQLNLSRCQIVLLPEEEWDLPQLQILDLSNNRIRDFPSQTILKGMPLLQSLNLYGNRLTNVPTFGEVGVVKFSTETSYLYIHNDSSTSSSNHPHHHPTTTTATTSTRPTTSTTTTRQQPHRSSLSSQSHYGSYDASVLTHLTYLNIGYNDITQLPLQLPKTLKTLVACNNMIQEVPMSLILSSSSSPSLLSSPSASSVRGGRGATIILFGLKELDVSSNPIRHPPPHICQAGLKAMQKYVQKRADCYYRDTEESSA